MKKILILGSLFMALLMTACYDDYKTDYVYTASYFAYQYPVRTLVVDPDVDDMEFKVGITYGGKYSYDNSNESVNFIIDESLITDDPTITDMGISVFPSDAYTLSDDSKITMQNSSVGFVTVKINKSFFESHPEAAFNTYAIPFRITSASTDSIVSGKDFSIVVVKFKNEFDGRYYVKGVDNKLNPDGSILESMTYSNNEDIVLNKYVYLNSTSSDEVAISRVGRYEDADKYVYKMKIRESDGSAILSADPTSSITQLVGAAQYDYASKSFVCKYNYTFDGYEYSVCDTLVYSNTEISLEEWK